MLSRFFLLSLLCINLVLAVGCSNQTPSSTTSPYIAKVGTDFEISFEELDQYAQSRFYQQRFDDNYEGYLQALNLLVDNQLKRLDFFDRGLHNNRELTRNILRTINEELVIRYFRTEFLGEYITEEEIRQAYDKMGREVTYRQIVLNKPENTEPDTVESIQQQAVDIRDSIENGADFDELVSRYSQHERSVRVSGYMEPIDWRRSLLSPLYGTIFELGEGETRIFNAPQAFYILKVDDITDEPVEPLDEVRDEIRDALEDRYMNQSLEKFDQFQQDLIDEDSFEWHEEALTQILDWSQTPRFFRNNIYRDTLGRTLEEGDNFTIAVHDGGEVNLSDYLRLLDEILIPGEGDLEIEDIKNQVKEALRTDLTANKAREAGLEEEVFHPYSKNPVIRNRLVEIYNQHIIDEQVPEPDEKALRKFYEANKDSLYYQLHTVTTYMVVSDDRETAEQRLQQYRDGTSFRDLAHEVLVRVYYRDRNGELRTRHSRNELPLGDIVITMQPDEVAGPASYEHPEKGTQYALIYCTRVLEEKQLTFEEVADRVEEDYDEYHRELIEKELLEELYNRYEVVIHRDYLRERMSEAGLI